MVEENRSLGAVAEQADGGGGLAGDCHERNDIWTILFVKTYLAVNILRYMGTVRSANR